MCGICKNESRNSLCYKCKKKIQKEFKFTKIHTKDKNFLEQYYLFQYKDLIRNMILEMKFQKKPYIYKTIEYFLQNNKKYLEKLKKYDIIIPVPMTNKKIKERGYNQTEIIAKIISQNITNITMQKNVLIKYKNNKVQSQLNKEQRQQNVQNVYELNNEEIIKNKNILILDDIYTTGATCNECVKTLKNAQPKKIGIITIAKDCEKIQVKNNRKE